MKEELLRSLKAVGSICRAISRKGELYGQPRKSRKRSPTSRSDAHCFNVSLSPQGTCGREAGAGLGQQMGRLLWVVLGLWLILWVSACQVGPFEGATGDSAPGLGPLSSSAPAALEQESGLANGSVVLPQADEGEKTTIVAPSVQGDRLWGALGAIVGQRYTEAERARTRQYLTEVLTALGWQVESQAFEQGVNLLARWPSIDSVDDRPDGSEVLLAAHYDTVQGSPGADDNGTGVAVLLEVARLYSAQQAIAPRQGRLLQLAFFDQEEAGLLGSLAFVSEASRLAPLHGVVVLDMLGVSCYEPGCQAYPAALQGWAPSDRGDFVAVVGEADRPGLLAAFARGAEGRWPVVFPLPVPFKGLLTPDVLRSDHAPFWLVGVGAVLLTDTANLRNPHYHQPTDTLETIDVEFFEGAAQRVVEGVWLLLQA